MSKSISPIFILASERSGTNLLRSLLSNHSNIHGPISPHFIDSFSSISRYYRPLTNKENGRNLFEAMLALANHPYNDWKLNINYEDIWMKYNPTSFYDYFNLIYTEKALAINKKRVVCKEIHIWNYLFQILEYYKNVQIIYLYRDPRDYVASWVKKPLFINTAYDAINNWINEQESIDILINTYGIKVYPVKYEDLISDTENIMCGILEYAGEQVEEACFRTNTEEGKAVSWNPYWENLANPINSNNSGNYRKILDMNSVRMIETRACYYMNKFAYLPETKCDWEKKRFTGFKNKIIRKVVQLKNKEHIYSKMSLLHSKLELVEQMKVKAKKRFEEIYAPK